MPSALAPERLAARRERLASLARLVGRTPLLALTCRLDGRELTVYAKHETANMTGSVKDRMALHMLNCATDGGELQPGDVIAEATSGNTGISFAALGRALGHRVRLFMPDWMSDERKRVMTCLGAELVQVSREQGGFLGAIALADTLAATHPGVWRPQQFSNERNTQAHRRGTGPELLAQLSALGLSPTGFVAGVGTGGTVSGVGQALREAVPGVAVHPLEPADSPTLRTGERHGSHRIQGISDEFIPPIVHLDELDAIVDVRDGDAIRMAQRLAAELGLGVGISSGANLLGALMTAAEQGPRAVVATVFPDSHKKYLTTDLCRDEPIREGDLTPRVQLLGFSVVPGMAATASG